MDPNTSRVKRYSRTLSLFWSVLLVCSFAAFYKVEKAGVHQVARAEARVAYQKDLLFRTWATKHGGVYVPVAPDTPPNPNLSHMPERDITTPSGKNLTLVNPAYMLRQLFELSGSQTELVQGHITSLHPIRPENAPDPWEEKALKAFEKGAKEVSEIQVIDGKQYMRLMRPFITEQPCLKCHASQGYRQGNVRGGISIKVPMSIFAMGSNNLLILTGATHLLLWVLGLGAIHFGTRRLLESYASLNEQNHLLKEEIAQRKRTEEQLEEKTRALEKETGERQQYEEALQKTKFFLSEGQKIAHLGSFEYIPETGETVWSEEQFHIYGLPPAGQSPPYEAILAENIHPDDADLLHQKFAAALSSGSTYELEHRIIRPDGSERWVYDRAEPYFDSNGKILRYIGITLDITDRKQAEQELLKKTEELDRYFTQSLDLLCIADTSGRFLRLNPEWEKVLGYSLPDLEGSIFLDFVHPDDREGTLAAIARLDAQEEVLLFENRYRCKDGSYRWIEWRSHPEGSLIYAVARDITTRKNVETALRESEERWKFALEGAGDGLWDWNIFDNRIHFSHQWKAIIGCTDQEVGNTYEEWCLLLHPDDRSSACADLERHLRGETGIYTSEHRVRCQDGTYMWVLDRGKVMSWTPEGKPSRFIGTHSDISGRKRTELLRNMGQEILQVLNEQEILAEGIQKVIKIIRTTTLVSAVGVRLQDGDNFPYFHQEGYPPELKENSLLVRTRDGGVCLDEFGNVCLECTCGQVIAEQSDDAGPAWTPRGSYWTNDATVVLELPAEQDSRTNPCNECIHQGFASIALIPIKAKGRVVGLLQLGDRARDRFSQQDIQALEGVAENIGEALLRKQAEEKLAARERFLRILTDQLPGMVGYWTRELRCSFANKAYQEWFGRSPEQMFGITMQELMGEELFRKNEPFIRKALLGEPQHFERTLVKPDGAVGYTWAHYMPDLVDGEVQGFYVLVSDVTDLKKAEDEKQQLEAQLRHAQKMESIGRLAGGVAHDFNNKLMVILGSAELALMDVGRAERVRQYLNDITLAARHSRDITAQLLAFSRQQVVTPKILNVNRVIAESKKSLSRLIGEDVAIHFHPGDGLWNIEIDPVQLDQIIMNLAVNARDAMPAGGTITIATRNVRADERFERGDGTPGEYVQINFSDSGTGIDKEALDHIFEPFFTTKEQGKGTGLGLATIYGIVSQHNGHISVASEAGQGTTFSLHFPHQDTPPDPESPEAAPPQQGSEAILVIEDDEPVLKVTERFLLSLGYTVYTAGSPSEALELCADESLKIDVVVSDVVMPIMNGPQVVELITAQRPKVKVLYVSGYTTDHTILEIVKNEGHFIQKPYDVKQLGKKLCELLGKE